MNYTYYRRYQPQKRKSSFGSFFWFVLFLVLMILALRACISVVSNLNEEKRDEAILSVNQGSAELLLWGQNDWEDAADSQIVLEGDSVRTGEGAYVTLEFYNGSELRLDENTQLNFASVEVTEDADEIVLQLVDGRAYLDHEPLERGEMDIELRTDIMNLGSIGGEYLVSNLVDDEYVYVMDGQVTAEFVDRFQSNGSSDDDGAVIETVILNDGSKSVFNDSKQRALLDRDNVTLSGEIEDGELLGDEFLMWNMGTLEVEEEVVVEAEVVVEEEVAEEEELVEEPEEIADVVEDEIVTEIVAEVETESDEAIVSDEALSISITSPDWPLTVTETAVAIEGQVVSGEADEVYVTWSGNGEPYMLSLFESGSDTFRYVVDVNYLNFAAGENTYKVVAYDEAGNVSNVINVVITGEF
jgi:hypothetical protein